MASVSFNELPGFHAAQNVCDKPDGNGRGPPGQPEEAAVCLSFNELPIFQPDGSEDEESVNSGSGTSGRNDSSDSRTSKNTEGHKEVTDLLEGMRMLLEGQQRLEEILSRHVAAQPDRWTEPPTQRSATLGTGSELSMKPKVPRSMPGASSKGFEARPAFQPSAAEPAPLSAQSQDMWVSHQTEDSEVAAGGHNPTLGSPYTVSFLAGNVRDRRWCPVLHPMAPFRVAMDLVSVVVLMYDLFSLPLLLAFDMPLEGGLLYLAMSSVSFWVLDMILRFRTGYFRDSHLEMRPQTIVRNYLRGTFLLDFSLIMLDVLTLSLNLWAKSEAGSETDLFKVWRMSKMTRIMRCISFFRLRVMADIVDRLSMQSKVLQATSTVVYDLLKLVCGILWLNHLMACAWVGLGRSVDGDTGVTWLDTPIGGGAPVQVTYAVCGHFYQYLTAVHWALSQMTPGSMQVFPVNSSERLFNCIGLTFGMLVFSTLISSIVSTVAQFKQRMKLDNAKLETLTKFLRKENVNPMLSMLVRKQVEEKLTVQKPLVLTDVKAFEWLPLSMQVIVKKELCSPHLTRHSFFSFVLAADEPTAAEFCRTCAEFTVLGPGDTLFLAGTQAVGMYFVVRGSLVYSQEKRSRAICETPTKEKTPDVHKGDCLSEAALWCNWRHVGRAEAPPKDCCEILSLLTDSFLKFMSAHGTCGHIVSTYARSFCAFLNASFTWLHTEPPTDLQQPFLVDEVIGALPREVKGHMGLVALRELKRVIRTRGGVWSDPDEQRIREEAINGQGATLVLTNRSKWGVRRFSSEVVLKLRRRDGKLMVALRQLGRGREAEAKLPGLRAADEEFPEDTFQRLVAKYFGSMAESVQRESTEREDPVVVQVDDFGVMTVLSKYVFHARWEPANVAEGCGENNAGGAGSTMGVPPRREMPDLSLFGREYDGVGGIGQTPRVVRIAESAGGPCNPVNLDRQTSEFSVAEWSPDMVFLPSGVLAAWFTQEQLHRSNTEDGQGRLGRWLAGKNFSRLPRRKGEDQSWRNPPRHTSSRV